MVIDRIELTKRMDVLTAENCEGCPNKNLGTSACEGCKVFEEFNKISDQFTEEVKTRRKKKRKKLLVTKEKPVDQQTKEEKIRNFIIKNHKEMAVFKMARELGVSDGLVKRRLDILGLKKKAKPSYIYIHFRDGVEVKRGSIKDISEHSNIPQDTVYGWFYGKSSRDEVKRIRKVE